MRRPAAEPTAQRSFSSLCAITAPVVVFRSLHRQHVGRIQQVELAENPDQAARALSGGLIGSPETLRRKLRRFQNLQHDQVILLNQAGKNAHAHICESLELFAKEVMPEFHAAEPAHQAWKQRVLAGKIELEEIDTQPFRDRYGTNCRRFALWRRSSSFLTRP